MDKKTIKSASDVLASMQGGIEKLSGVVDAQAVEKVLGKDFTCRRGDGFKITFRRFKDEPTKGYFVFERTKD